VGGWCSGIHQYDKPAGRKWQPIVDKIMTLWDLLRKHGSSIRRRERQTSLPVASVRRASNSAPVMTGEGWKFANKRALIALRNVIVRVARNSVKVCGEHRFLHRVVEGVGNEGKLCSKQHIRYILILPNASQKDT